MADSSRTGLSQAMEQAFITFAGAIAQNNSAAQTGSSVQQSASATVASSSVVTTQPPLNTPALTPTRNETRASSASRYLAILIYLLCVNVTWINKNVPAELR